MSLIKIREFRSDHDAYDSKHPAPNADWTHDNCEYDDVLVDECVDQFRSAANAVSKMSCDKENPNISEKRQNIWDAMKRLGERMRVRVGSVSGTPAHRVRRGAQRVRRSWHGRRPQGHG